MSNEAINYFTIAVFRSASFHGPYFTMPHTTELIGSRKISNGQFAIDILCCGEHAHPHTIGSEVMNNPAKLAQSIQYAHTQAAADHAAANALESDLEALKGQKVEHS